MGASTRNHRKGVTVNARLDSAADLLDNLQVYPGKSCGGCAACCHLLAVRELNLPSFHSCPHVRDALHIQGPGCGIYARRPPSCRMWICGWLSGDAKNWPDDLRPDRCGFVVDVMTDVIRINDADAEAAQIWVSRGHEDAWQRDPGRAVLLAIIDQGMAVIWRMHGGKAIGFGRDEHGNLARSEVILASSDDELGGNWLERHARLARNCR